MTTNRALITSFSLAQDVRVRIAGGEVAFVAGGKVYDNFKYENTWHTFPAGAKFELAGMVDQTDTYLMVVTERIVPVQEKVRRHRTPRGSVQNGSSIKSDLPAPHNETFGAFLRKASYDKILKAADQDTVVSAEETEELINDELSKINAQRGQGGQDDDLVTVRRSSSKDLAKA